MFSLDIDYWQDEKDLLIAEVFELGSTGINEMEGFLRVFFEDDADREALRARFPEARERAADDRDWVAASREQLQPRAVGKRFFLVPEWRDDPAPEGRIRIVVNAGLAFGTGHHESTRLCLELLEEHLKPGDAAADVGTGSGILAEAAYKLGAGSVVACDIETETVEVALRNLEAARVPVAVFEGSADRLPAASADLLLANISPEALAALAREFVRVLKPGGVGILSGIESPDLEALLPELERAGLNVTETRSEANWRALVVRPGAAHKVD